MIKSKSNDGLYLENQIEYDDIVGYLKGSSVKFDAPKTDVFIRGGYVSQNPKYGYRHALGSDDKRVLAVCDDGNVYDFVVKDEDDVVVNFDPINSDKYMHFKFDGDFKEETGRDVDVEDKDKWSDDSVTGNVAIDEWRVKVGTDEIDFPISVSFWFKKNTRDKYITKKEDGDGKGDLFRIRAYRDYIIFYGGKADATISSNNNKCVDGAWNHVVLVFKDDDINHLTAYINGVEANVRVDKDDEKLKFNDKKLMINADKSGAIQIDNFIIYKKAIDANEARKIYLETSIPYYNYENISEESVKNITSIVVYEYKDVDMFVTTTDNYKLNYFKFKSTDYSNDLFKDSKNQYEINSNSIFNFNELDKSKIVNENGESIEIDKSKVSYEVKTNVDIVTDLFGDGSCIYLQPFHDKQINNKGMYVECVKTSDGDCTDDIDFVEYNKDKKIYAVRTNGENYIQIRNIFVNEDKNVISFFVKFNKLGDDYVSMYRGYNDFVDKAINSDTEIYINKNSIVLAVSDFFFKKDFDEEFSTDKYYNFVLDYVNYILYIDAEKVIDATEKYHFSKAIKNRNYSVSFFQSDMSLLAGIGYDKSKFRTNNGLVVNGYVSFHGDVDGYSFTGSEMSKYLDFFDYNSDEEKDINAINKRDIFGDDSCIGLMRLSGNYKERDGKFKVKLHGHNKYDSATRFNKGKGLFHINFYNSDKCFYFDGDSYLELDTELKDVRTVSMFFRVHKDAKNDDDVPYCLFTGSKDGKNTFNVFYKNKKLLFYINDEEAGKYEGVDKDKLYHLVVTTNGKVFLDGKLVINSDKTVDTDSFNKNFLVGADRDNDEVNDEFYGYIEQVRFFDKVITDEKDIFKLRYDMSELSLYNINDKVMFTSYGGITGSNFNKSLEQNTLFAMDGEYKEFTDIRLSENNKNVYIASEPEYVDGKLTDKAIKLKSNQSLTNAVVNLFRTNLLRSDSGNNSFYVSFVYKTDEVKDDSLFFSVVGVTGTKHIDVFLKKGDDKGVVYVNGEKIDDTFDIKDDNEWHRVLLSITDDKYLKIYIDGEEVFNYKEDNISDRFGSYISIGASAVSKSSSYKNDMFLDANVANIRLIKTDVMSDNIKPITKAKLNKLKKDTFKVKNFNLLTFDSIVDYSLNKEFNGYRFEVLTPDSKFFNNKKISYKEKGVDEFGRPYISGVSGFDLTLMKNKFVMYFSIDFDKYDGSKKNIINGGMFIDNYSIFEDVSYISYRTYHSTVFALKYNKGSIVRYDYLDIRNSYINGKRISLSTSGSTNIKYFDSTTPDFLRIHKIYMFNRIKTSEFVNNISDNLSTGSYNFFYEDDIGKTFNVVDNRLSKVNGIGYKPSSDNKVIKLFDSVTIDNDRFSRFFRFDKDMIPLNMYSKVIGK